MMNHRMIIWLLCISIQVGGKQLYGQTDSLNLVKIDPYFRKILESNHELFVIGGGPQSVLKTSEPVFKDKGQQIIKTDSNLYIHMEGSGRLYRAMPYNDSVIQFIRIDKTESINYNGGGFLFSSGEDIYILGGYGFWKSNGTLKKFNFHDQEWDVIPLSEERFPPGYPHPGAWYDSKSKRIYLMYEAIVNDALFKKNKEEKRPDHTFILDLKTRTWEKSSPVNKEVWRMMKTSGSVIYHEKGYLLLDRIDLFLIDLKNNQLLKMTDQSFSQTLSRVFSQELLYSKDDKVFFRDKKTGKLDSLVIPKEKFVNTTIPVFQASIPKYTYWSGLLILIIAFTIFIYFRLDRYEENIGVDVTQFPTIGFSEIEISLIQLLIKKSKNYQKTDIHELNYVLGVKDKNIGLQKKVRSEAIHGINEKFRFITGYDHNLICNERTATDKRYFEYYIPTNLIKPIMKLIR